MPEAEDVITDAARHATVFAQELWRRRREGAEREPLDVPALLHRVDLFVTAAFERSFPLRIAQPPPPRTFARKLFRRHEQPAARDAVPATDGVSVWLPAPAPDFDEARAIARLRLTALEQAARAARDAPGVFASIGNPLQRSIFEVLEADAADADLIARFGALAQPLAALRREMLDARPPIDAFPAARKPLEAWLRSILSAAPATKTIRTSPQLCEDARALLQELAPGNAAQALVAAHLFRDQWLGELRTPPPARQGDMHTFDAQEDDAAERAHIRSARMPRRPNVREADERDERTSQGAWMVQTAQPNEHAEDPFGLQRPVDRDEDSPAEGFAESLSELPEARLVASQGAPKEVLISEDPPEARARKTALENAGDVLSYPEWDWRRNAYREPGAAVHLLEAPRGPQEWVERTLEEHHALLQEVRRQFESLRARRMRLRQQLDGEDIDLEACIDAFADARAGGALRPGLYQTIRNASRDMAVLLLIDVSGSTDGWASSHRRVIDVEREALLLVCLALESLGEPYSVLAFSGEGPSHVTMRSIKSFAEAFGEEIGLRIAGLEPERYTRAGAAIRHASAVLMRERAEHRLLLVLSDGKPNDVDEYDGRYGVEDMRQSVIEARLQGIYPFCLTIDRQTANYLPAVFGEGQYAVLHRPELLPTALLGWLRRLVRS